MNNQNQKNNETSLYPVLDRNVGYLRKKFNGSADFSVKYLHTETVRCAVVTMEGMCDKELLSIGVIKPLITDFLPKTDSIQQLLTYMERHILSVSEVSRTETFEDVMNKIMSGFAVLLIEGCSTGIAIGVQGYSFRSVSEPDSEISERGSREGFVEPLHVNMTLLRRRIKSPNLKLETMTVGDTSHTELCLCYLTNIVSENILKELKQKLNSIKLDTVLASGYLVPFLEDSNGSTLFSGVGITERPDTVSGKITEGRIAVLIDGTPSALILPYLFMENFQTMGDYSYKPYYATLIRWMKYLCFFVASLLPGMYISVALFNPELFPEQILIQLETSFGSTPFGLVTEILLVLFMYEIMREAGLRLPKSLGHAVSIVGALVIGDTAVSAGLIVAPTLMIVALTAIASYVIPDLYPQLYVLRILFIIAGGLFGIWGVVLLFCVLTVDLCGKSTLGVPYTMPVTPFRFKGMRDVIIRADWKILGRFTHIIKDIPTR